jgi:Na+/melibiose symporter-like transporter
MEMANTSIYYYDSISIFYITNFISNTKLMELNIQNILVVTSLILAIIFLVKKFSPKKTKGNCLNKDCGCS